ncbi:AI-2E family transporter [Mesorhizobium denitrificans]|uniref:AI-2E family transporter n=2 Tax=Mesorhizobium TaxID=68287 RepID=A0A371XID0_9HYPH|nr:AI-2E family transporter [Mesorhizobium denitrificans]
MANGKIENGTAENAFDMDGRRLSSIAIPPVVSLVGVTAILYLGQEVFLPLAVALLLTFALAPIVSALRKLSIPRPAAVILTVTVAFLCIALFSFMVASQLSSLAQNIPTYQSNIIQKVRSLKDSADSGGIFERVTQAVERVGAEMSARADQRTTGERQPLPVEIVDQQSAIYLLVNVVVPLLSPFATAGLVIVVVIFMLLEREDLRDRFIRLVGTGDLHRTTQALQDAGKRVGQYLLMQLIINTSYAVPIGIGLWLLGIPNAILWALLSLVLRFVPYIGPAISMILPLFLAIAVTPGWTTVLWTAGLFLVMELFINNVMEPWLYGSRTGLSPLAIIVAAIFWTWLWGPVGLVLSTPLTVCLVVLGRHVPQFEFLDVLFGNEPVLEPDARLYQRLLAGDPDEAADNAETILEDKYLVEYYDEIGIPALLFGESDRERGALQDGQLRRFASTALTFVEDLEDAADELREDEQGDEKPVDEDGERLELPDGEGFKLVMIGGRTELDDVAAAILAQVVEGQGAEASIESFRKLHGSRQTIAGLAEADIVVVSYLSSTPLAYARQAVRRLKRGKRGLRVGIYVPNMEEHRALDAKAISADFVATSVVEAVRLGLVKAEAVALARTTRLKPSRIKKK